MSTYSSVGGTITYETPEAFEAARQVLIQGGWLSEQGIFSAEYKSGELTEEPTVSVEDRTITIPAAYYRNLARVLDQVFKGGKGTLVWTSTDGQFQGGVIVDGNETLYDLEQWIRGQVSAEDAADPESEDYIPPADATDEDAVQARVDWQCEVETDFFAEFGSF